MNQSFFLRTFFHSALAILETQSYIVMEQFGAENISLVTGRLVRRISITKLTEYYYTNLIIFY